MTTPASNTPYAIITDANVDAGRLPEGQVLSSERLASGLRRLNDIINLWLTQGLKLWLLVDTAVTLTEGQATYTFKPSGNVDMTKPLRVLQGYFLPAGSAPSRRPLTVLSWERYLMLGNVATEGAINSYFVNKRATQLDVTFWLTPDATDATGVAHVLLETQATNPVNLTETMDFPQEWRIALRWGLADDLATGQPEAIMNRCSQRAEHYRKMLEDADVEDAPTSFAPDTRQTQHGYSFR